MTKCEAVNVLGELRTAVMALNPLKGRQAFNALINDMQRAADVGNAAQDLRAAFQEIENRGIRFPAPDV